MTDTQKPVKSFRLDAPTRKAIEIMAQLEKRSEAQIVEFAIEEYFTRHYERLLETIKDADDHQD